MLVPAVWTIELHVSFIGCRNQDIGVTGALQEQIIVPVSRKAEYTVSFHQLV